MSQRAHPAGAEPLFPRGGYSDEEREFILAMERYRRLRQRRFPSCREVLDVLKSLGYRKVAEAEVGGQRSEVRQNPSDPSSDR